MVVNVTININHGPGNVASMESLEIKASIQWQTCGSKLTTHRSRYWYGGRSFRTARSVPHCLLIVRIILLGLRCARRMRIFHLARHETMLIYVADRVARWVEGRRKDGATPAQAESLVVRSRRPRSPYISGLATCHRHA